MAPAPRLTVDDYLRTPESVIPQELVFGQLRVADAPTPRHQAALFRFATRLDDHVTRRALGAIWLAPVDVFLDVPRALVVQPDLIFVSSERLPIVRDRVWGAPDLVLEVMSPTPRIGRLDERLGWFAEYGVRECWLVHQFSSRVEVLTLDRSRPAKRRVFEANDRIQSTLLPHFNLFYAVIVGDPGQGPS